MDKLFHVFSFIHFLYGVYYDQNYVKHSGDIIPIHKLNMPLNGRSMFLTHWNVLIQTFFFGLCVLCDITGSKTLKKFKNFLHTTIAFPLAFIVGITFWAIYAIDRELIFPKVLDEYFPGWLNHLMHTNIMVFTVIEMITSERNYPKRSTGIKTLMAFLLTYCIWMNIIYQVTGYWVYPIMEVLSIPLQILFYLLVLGFGVSLYIVGEHFNSYVWLKDISSEQRSNKNKRS
ncbi:androgen-induced gene 1 protein-like isoform X3 [Chrysoperla carnea]|uniref:androgen-induced gene 1 protein-like isoform X3 n=1 Tax=Chrysoperla carnea TaxID=189513 RepID=UPI001D05ED7D|nr:androgen-induced gene 1 protein-like isoform X3 [Chrysoperla carnea]